MEDLRTEFKTDMKDLRTEMNTLNTMILQKIEILGMKFDSTQKEIILANKEQLSGFLLDQQKQFSQFYFRGFFGVNPTLYILY